MNIVRDHDQPGSAVVYGGVGHDLTALTLPFRAGQTGQPFWLRLLHVPMGLLDLPFSFVADTIHLPWTVSHLFAGPSEGDPATTRPSQPR
ncbi:MAG: YceK/YidQ family lipoprotein [Planctomycetes bacterium]|nr:YceK/YidQ family lipoprotein [Planctomycetota bacterium]